MSVLREPTLFSNSCARESVTVGELSVETGLRVENVPIAIPKELADLNLIAAEALGLAHGLIVEGDVDKKVLPNDL